VSGGGQIELPSYITCFATVNRMAGSRHRGLGGFGWTALDKAFRRGEQAALACPFQPQFLLFRNAVAQVQVDQALIRNAALPGQCAEIVDRVFVQSNRQLGS